MQVPLFESFIFLTALFLAQAYNETNPFVVYCYWGTWSQSRPLPGKFEVSNIDASLCTHIGYAFFGLDENYRIKSLRTKLDFDLENIAKTVALKEKYTNLKVMAAVGGWKEGSKNFSAMASTASNRATFISSALEFLQQHKFDGLDLDWEYPAQRGGIPDDRNNFVTLLSELNAVLKPKNLLLSIAVAADQTSANISYDIPNVAKHVDLINVMSYSFASPHQKKTGFKAPLQGAGNRTVKSAINFWLKSGAPADKLVMGLAFNGRSFTLAKSEENWINAPAAGNGTAGNITRTSGILGYNEICENLKSGWTRYFNWAHVMAYAFNDTQWVGYDDPESLKYKIQYMKSLNLTGVMIWSIETDDFRGNCGETYPLLKSIKRHLEANETILRKSASTKINTAFNIILFISMSIIFILILLVFCFCRPKSCVQVSFLATFFICFANFYQN